MGGSSTTCTTARPAPCSVSSAAPEAAALVGMASRREGAPTRDRARSATLLAQWRNTLRGAGGGAFYPHRLPRGERIDFAFCGGHFGLHLLDTRN